MKLIRGKMEKQLSVRMTRIPEGYACAGGQPLAVQSDRSPGSVAVRMSRLTPIPADSEPVAEWKWWDMMDLRLWDGPGSLQIYKLGGDGWEDWNGVKPTPLAFGFKTLDAGCSGVWNPPGKVGFRPTKLRLTWEQPGTRLQIWLVDSQGNPMNPRDPWYGRFISPGIENEIYFDDESGIGNLAFMQLSIEMFPFKWFVLEAYSDVDPFTLLDLPA